MELGEHSRLLCPGRASPDDVGHIFEVRFNMRFPITSVGHWLRYIFRRNISRYHVLLSIKAGRR